MNALLDNGVYVSEKAKDRILKLMADAGHGGDPSYFLRVSCCGRRLFRSQL
jgi:hypothetical protein